MGFSLKSSHCRGGVYITPGVSTQLQATSHGMANLPWTITCTVATSVATSVADTPLCVLVPVHLYIPSWVGNTAFVMGKVDVRLPTLNVNGDTSVITGSTGVPSTGINGRGSVSTNSHSMVGVKIPVEVHVILTEPPSTTVIGAEPMIVVDGIAKQKG